MEMEKEQNTEEDLKMEEERMEKEEKMETEKEQNTEEDLKMETNLMLLQNHQNQFQHVNLELFQNLKNVCSAKSVCTKKLCVCFKTIDTCVQTTSFPRDKVCLCGTGKQRSCIGASCICKVQSATTGSSIENDSTNSNSTSTKTPQCKYGVPYTKRSCLCNKFQKCVKSVGTTPSQCVCHETAPACVGKSFEKKLLCGCAKRGEIRVCKGTKCSCKKVPACNQYRSYPTKNTCYCSKKFHFMACKKSKTGKKSCGCVTLDQECALGQVVRKGTCYCKQSDNSFSCQKKEDGVFCVCRKKEYCPLDEYLTRNSCRCWRKPTDDLQDPNSEKGRVLRRYGWKKCRPSDKKNPSSRRECQCQVLKCHEAGRFKKYFCQCPRKTHQKCNKTTDYCKCVPEKPFATRYPGNYKFDGFMTVKSRKIASYKFEKRKIKVYTLPNKQRTVKRFVFVDHQDGSYRVVQKPSIKTPAAIRKELALYDVNDQNFAYIQKQLKKKQPGHKKGGSGSKKK